MTMRFKVGFVYHIDSLTFGHGRKRKYGICVSATEGFVLLINTKNREMYDCIPILATEHPKLKANRYVSCNAIHTPPDDAIIEECYPISDNFKRTLISKIESSRLLSKVLKQIILKELK